MNKFYLAVQENHAGKRIAYVVELNDAENVFNVLSRIPNAEFGNLFPTRKKAREVALFWNECSKRNGDYLYSREA